MNPKSFNNLLIPSEIKACSLTSQSNTSATGNPRNKCALQPGHSLMDWIRLSNSGADLSGTGGRTLAITREELAKHNTRNDAWIALRGVVYNVTQYMDFHPGGVQDLMSGVGSDATRLFNGIHAWVNYSQLLNKCCIGPLSNGPLATEKLATLANSKAVVSMEKSSRFIQDIDIVPRLDWIQRSDDITIYFFTKQFCNPGFIIRNLDQEDKCLEIWIFIDLYVHKFNFELRGRIKWPPTKVQTSTESGKIQIKLDKYDDLKLWSDLGKYTTTKTLACNIDLETSSLQYKMIYKNKFNHDSYLIMLGNENLLYTVPVGYHIAIKGFVDNLNIIKCYTPIPEKYIEKYIKIDIDYKYINLLIKQYPHPTSFTQYLCNLENDTRFNFFLPKGNIKLLTLASYRKFCFLAAGSGLTPFLSLIDHLLKRYTNRIEKLKLIYFNKTSSDIWCKEILANITTEDERFEFINILSNPEESWPGIKGHITSELLLPTIRSVEKISYIAVCGPHGFTENVEKILKELNFSNENIFIF